MIKCQKITYAEWISYFFSFTLDLYNVNFPPNLHGYTLIYNMIEFHA